MPISPAERETIAAKYRTLKQSWTMTPREYYLQQEHLKQLLHQIIDVEFRESALSFTVSALDHFKQSSESTVK